MIKTSSISSEESFYEPELQKELANKVNPERKKDSDFLNDIFNTLSGIIEGFSEFEGIRMKGPITSSWIRMLIGAMGHRVYDYITEIIYRGKKIVFVRFDW